jgi:pilus assembly protein CpaF
MAVDTSQLVRIRERDSRPAYEEDWSDLVAQVHARLLQDLDLAAVQKLDPEAARASVASAARQLLQQIQPSLAGDAREQIVERLLDEAVGFGPIQRLLDDPSISEVMVNAPDEVYFERDGIIYLSPARFRDHAHIMRVIERIVAPIGRRVDESSAYVDARLPDGSRVNVIIPPLAPKGPTVTVRKFRPDKYKMSDLVAIGTLTDEVAGFFRAAVEQRLNIIVSGGTGTGKTTFLNAVSEYIPDRERIVTIEDPIEMKLQQAHVVPLEARPPNLEGANEVTQRDLVRNALRMRPDRIIVGEVRGGEAFDMMQAMNTGHEGSLTTVHANGARDALSRIENMVLMTGFDLPIRAIREQMASALNLVVQLARHGDGKRRVIAIAEITGVESGIITLADLYRFEQTGVGRDGAVEGELLPTGIMPTFAERFQKAGVELRMGLAATRWR